jgi:hypothetical protein
MGTDTPSVSPAFAQVLRSGRDHFNAQFVMARRQFGELDPSAFGDFLRRVAEPLVCASAELAPDSVGSVAQAAYEVGLELVGQRLYGPAARHPHFGDGFARMLCAYAARVAEAPRSVLAALGNALHHLAATAGARPAEFVEEMVRVAAQVPDLGTLLTVGQVQAWRAGLAHFRSGALEGLGALSEPLAKTLVGGAAGVALTETLARLRNDPWFDPDTGRRHQGAWIGGFRGFGGLFGLPPVVRASGGRLLVQSAGQHWVLVADRFGATLHRALDQEVRDASPLDAACRSRVEAGGLRLDGIVLDRAARGDLTSAADVAGTLALTFSLTHSILLVPGALES